MWLYRSAVLALVGALALAVTGLGREEVVEPVVALSIGLVANGLGLVMAELLYRRHIDDQDFDSATQGLRMAVGVGGFVVVGVLLSTIALTGVGTTASTGDLGGEVAQVLSSGLSETIVGFAALALVIGDGYTKFRQVMRPRAH